MKPIKSLSVVALTLMAGTAVADPVKIGVAAEPYPPFSSPDSSGNWVGWEIEMIDAVCAAAELECVITPVAWDGIIPSLNSKQIDAIMASMSITEDRMKTIDFSDPYYNTPTVIVADSSMDIEPTPESLSGKILGVQASTVHQAYAQKYFTDAEIRVYQTQDEANQDLISGRIDATQADAMAMADFVEGSGCCEIKGSVMDDPAILGLGVGAGVRKGEPELLEALNMGVAAVIADGTRTKITIEYFGEDIF
ncbi:transporter substrate-binding domain-containing protein [Pseudooceanicola algae]|uniref:Histidine-binding periplasmic protein n=1 Tax=Pseudooceanicola algae TaxID=1537215 RepID=A0A418SD57_9RHOB|nr:transporter substrate-binding domain-containing protein [Pseudooceanicola algae]QPM92385.1 Histidine-binding periplasmic protein [Pseudooceanicola algae]